MALKPTHTFFFFNINYCVDFFQFIKIVYFDANGEKAGMYTLEQTAA